MSYSAFLFGEEDLDLVASTVWRKGPIKQWGLVQEECAELIAEISRRSRDRSSNEELADELADVIIVTQMARLMLDEGLVDRAIRKKLDRLKGRIDKGEPF